MGLEPARDDIADLLDELADLCEVWQRSRTAGRSAAHVRLAVLAAAGTAWATAHNEMMAAAPQCARPPVDWGILPVSPCPVCGGRGYRMDVLDGTKVEAVVRCGKCDHRGPQRPQGYAAVADWNAQSRGGL